MQSCGPFPVWANLPQSISGLCGLGLGSDFQLPKRGCLQQRHLLLQVSERALEAGAAHRQAALARN